MRREKVRRVDGHKCTLPLEDELIALYIYEGMFVNLRRKFRTFFMINASYPETRSVFKSTAQIRREEARHLRRYFFMIHPFSEGRVTWEMIMIVVYISLFLLMPMGIILIDPPAVLMYVILFFLVLCDVDIIISFFTGYYDKRARKVIMNQKKVCVRYLLRWFLVDVISSLPYNLIMHHTQRFDMYPIKYLYFFKIFRIHTLLDFIKKYCIRLDMWSFKLKCMSAIVYFVVVVWWGTTYVYVVYIISNELVYTVIKGENLDVFTHLAHSCMQVVRTFTLISIGALDDESVTVQLFYICLMFGGCVMNLVVIIQILQMYRRYSSSKDQPSKLTQEICEYMKYKELPAYTQKRILRYVEFKFRKNIIKDADILSTLSTILQQDVLLHNCKRLVEQVDFFKYLPFALLTSIVNKLRRMIYLSGDMMVQSGVMGNAMFFIYAGTVAVYSVTGKEICHLEDGDYFGEISLLINEPRVATVVAVTECEVFRLNRKDFLEVLEPYPKVYNKIKESALARLRSTRKIKNMEDLDNVLVAREEIRNFQKRHTMI